MKNILPIIIFSFTFFFAAQGQKIVITPATVEHSIVTDLSDFMTEVELPGKITNISSETITIKWTQTLWDQPFEWQTEISDRDNYYFTDESGYAESEYVMPLELKPGESFYLSIYVYPNGRAGTATYVVDLVDYKNPKKTLETLTFYVNIQHPKKEAAVHIRQVKLYPNPAPDYFEITPNILVSKIRLYNSIGQRIRTFETIPGMKYDISKIPDGLYLAELLDSDNKALKTFRLLKRTPKA